MSVMGPINCSTAAMREPASMRSLNTITFEVVNMPSLHVQICTLIVFSYKQLRRTATLLSAHPMWVQIVRALRITGFSLARITWKRHSCQEHELHGMPHHETQIS